MRTSNIIRLFSAFHILAVGCVYGQGSENVEASTTGTLICSYACSNSFENIHANCSAGRSSFVSEVALAPGDVHPYEEFDEIIRLLRKDPNNSFPLLYKFTACNSVCNAASCILPGPVEVIFYNQTFLNGLKGGIESTKWAIRCIIAHEIGHHILGHTSIVASLIGEDGNSPEARRKREKRADYFAGFVIRQFPGSTVDNAMEGLKSLDNDAYFPKSDDEEFASDYPTLSHRRQAVEDGFNAWDNLGVRIIMFNDIENVARQAVIKLGQFTIYRTLDIAMLSGDFKIVTTEVDRFLKFNPDFKDKELLFREQSIAYERLDKQQKAIKSQRKAVDFQPNDVDQLIRLRDLLNDGRRAQKSEAKIIQNRIENFRSGN